MKRTRNTIATLFVALLASGCGDEAVDQRDSGSPAGDAAPLSMADVDGGRIDVAAVTMDASGIDVTANDAAPDVVVANGNNLAMTQETLNRIGGGNRNVDPATLHVFIGTEERMCANPFRATIPCGRWMVSFRLPPALQKPGTWHIEDPAMNAFYSVSGPDRGGGDCSGGGGSLTYGDVTVLEVTPTTVSVKLEDVRTFEFDASGTYVVPRCP